MILSDWKWAFVFERPLTPTLSRKRLCRNGENGVIPAKAGIQILEIIVVSN